jgi:hypothetical protein
MYKISSTLIWLKKIASVKSLSHDIISLGDEIILNKSRYLSHMLQEYKNILPIIWSIILAETISLLYPYRLS